MRVDKIQLKQFQAKADVKRFLNVTGVSIGYIVVGLLSLSMLFPYFYMAMTSFKTLTEATTTSGINIIPSQFVLTSYKRIVQEINIFRGMGNTLLVAIPVITVGSFVSALAAFAFGKMKLKFSKTLLLILMSSMMIPYAALLLPQYQIYNSIGLTNTLWPLILPGLFGNVSMIFFLIQFMTGIPNSLFEAAKVDGCGFFKSFMRIMLPLLWPAVAAQGVFWFLGIWNDYFGPSIYLTKTEIMTLQPLITSLDSSRGIPDFPILMAGSLLSSMPLIAVYLFFQKYFIQAMSITSGIKG